ncbi:hypothetical protein KP004_03705 [Geomonas oryzisoli]|uniref:Uncharacterized protein n=1 Tax=Geomonas oryzisoli TaxID=2847992 RepID=A0ABX8JAY0_9BACT|nr:hypothetical protein [Geomonas oryzisoli]QWV94301.1 hypothetical protein KP004_03705 [Geomonas oryzisoli]
MSYLTPTLPFPPKGQVDYFDTELKGLALRVGRDVKTFFVQIDVFDQVPQALHQAHRRRPAADPAARSERNGTVDET